MKTRVGLAQLGTKLILVWVKPRGTVGERFTPSDDFFIAAILRYGPVYVLAALFQVFGSSVLIERLWGTS